MHGFAAYFLSAVESPEAEVLGREASGFIQDVHQHVGAVKLERIPLTDALLQFL